MKFIKETKSYLKDEPNAFERDNPITEDKVQLMDFNYAAFYADPEGYEFTEEDNRYFNAMELERYEATVPMTPAEKRALRKWVAAGNSIFESPGSKYVCSEGCSPPMGFLDVYRLDRELDQALKGKSKSEKEAYLKEYFGYQEPEEKLQQTEEQFHKLQRESYYLWMFISAQGLWEEAHDFLEETMDEPMLFEPEW